MQNQFSYKTQDGEVRDWRKDQELGERDCDAAYHLYRTGQMNIMDALKEAGVTKEKATEDTYVYISSETGLWTTKEKLEKDSYPVDYIGRYGFYVESYMWNVELMPAPQA